MPRPWARVCAAIAAGVATVITAARQLPAVAGAAVLPFPAGALPGWGALHTLCSLQCELRDPTTFSAQNNTIARNDRVCHSPIDTDSLPGGPENVVYPAEIGLGVQVRRVGSELGKPPGSLVRDTVYSAISTGRVACSEGGGEGRIVGEARVADYLTLTRNSIGGSVTRVNRRYEVLGVSRLSVGVCVDTLCSAVVAVDMAAPSVVVPCAGFEVGVACQFGGTPVLTYTGTDGVERPVSAGRHDLLSLGRGVLGRHDWLGPAAAAELSVASRVRVLNPQAVFLPPNVAPPAFTGTVHRLNGTPPTLLNGAPAKRTASGGTVWLDAIAWVLCSGQRGVYARDGAICDGVAPVIPARQVNVAGRTVSLAGVLEGGTGASLTAVWFMVPDVTGANTAPASAPAWVPGPAVNMTSTAATGPRLPFLAARGLRELNPDSPEERALAAALGRRTALLPIHSTRGISSGVSAALRMFQPSLDDLEADVGRLSATFDQRVWGVEEPDPPVNLNTIILAGVVLGSELGVLASLYWATSLWDSRAVWSYSFTVLVGAAGLAAFISQYVLERQGDAWRTAAVRDSLTAQTTGGAALAAPLIDLRGTVVVRTETLLLAARNGYHPTRMLGLLIGAAALYGIAAAALLVSAWR